MQCLDCKFFSSEEFGLIKLQKLSDHRVGRVLSVSPVVGIGTPPTL